MASNEIVGVDANGEVTLAHPNFFTQLDLPPAVGQSFPPNKRPVLKWNKERTALVDTGKVRDIDAEIQAASVGITPYDCLERVQGNLDRLGEVLPDSSASTQDMDVSDYPQTLAEEKAVSDMADLIQKEALNVRQQQDSAGLQKDVLGGDGKPADAASVSRQGADSGAAPSASQTEGQESAEKEGGLK